MRSEFLSFDITNLPIKMRLLVVQFVAVALLCNSCQKQQPKQDNVDKKPDPSAISSNQKALTQSAPPKTPLPQTRTSNNPEFPITGRESWNIGGTNYDIEGTSLLVLENGQTLFVIKALSDFQPDATHEPIARSLAKYAVDHGYHKKVVASEFNGKPQTFSGSVGVALIQKSGPGPVVTSSGAGYRYHFTVAELQQAKAPGDQSAPVTKAESP